MVGFETVATRCKHSSASDWCVMRLRKMQTLRRFLLHRDTEGVAFQITSEQWAEKDRHTGRECECKENRNRRDNNQ